MANNQSNTPLHLAVNKRKRSFSKALIAAGADSSAKNKKGDTPLHLAIKNNNIEAVQDLISADADFNAENKSGLTPLLPGLETKTTPIPAWVPDLVSGWNLFKDPKLKDASQNWSISTVRCPLPLRKSLVRGGVDEEACWSRI